MDLRSSLRPFLTFFYLLGLSAAPNEFITSSSPGGCTNKLFMLCQALLGIGAAVCCFVLMNFADCIQCAQWKRNDVVILNCILVCEISRVIFVLLQCLFYKTHIARIFSILRQLDSFFRIKFHHHIGYDTFKRNYLRKLAIYSTAFTQSLAIHVWNSFNNRVNSTEWQHKYLKLIEGMTILHIIFYIDVLAMFVAELNGVIRCEWSRKLHDVKYKDRNSTKHTLRDTKRILDQFKFYKFIHFEIWTAVQHVNAFFGWILLVILVQAFVDIIYSSYWFMQVIQPPLQWDKCISEKFIHYLYLNYDWTLLKCIFRCVFFSRANEQCPLSIHNYYWTDKQLPRASIASM